MSTLLAYALWLVLLSLPAGNAIWCFECVKNPPLERCPETDDLCWSARRDGCTTMKFYSGTTLTRTRVGCFPNCKKHKSADSKWFKMTCCFSDYCNA